MMRPVRPRAEASVRSTSDDLDAVLAGVLSDAPHADRSTLTEQVRNLDPLISSRQLNEVVEQAWQRAHGLGPITALLADPGITEVMVNGPGPVWIDRHGILEPTSIELGAVDIDLLIERIVDPLGLRVDRVSPMVDGRLPDGSRVNIVVPPLAVDGPVVTIRRFTGRPVPLDSFGPASVLSLLGQLMEDRKSIVVSGGTGAGKTTLLNSLGGLLHPDERIIVIEDTAELRLPGRHIVRLEGRPPNAEGVGGVSIRELVRNALRMRPDRLIVGEVRGAEALDLIMALNTGHRGTLVTCHANDAGAALTRLLNLALLGGVELSAVSIESQLRSAIDVIVHVTKSHRVRHIAEVVEVDRRTGSTRTLWRSDR